MFVCHTKGFHIRYPCVKNMKNIGILILSLLVFSSVKSQPQGNDFIEMLGKPATFPTTQAILNQIGNSNVKESFSNSTKTYSIESFDLGLALEFNQNFILKGMRFYDSGYLYSQSSFKLPLYHKIRIHRDYFMERYQNYTLDSSNNFLFHGNFDNGKVEVYFKDRHSELITFRVSEYFLKTQDAAEYNNWGYRIIPDGRCIDEPCIEGQHRMIWGQSNLVLESMWKYGTPHGLGNFDDSSGVKFNGKFKLGFLWDEGSLVVPKNFNYTGKFIMGKRNGQGDCTFANGGRYKGDWQNDQMHGDGTFWYSENYLYQGQFTRNEISGKGKLITPQGTFTGSFKKGKPHGYVEQYVNISQTQLAGNWVNGKKEGKFVHQSPIFGTNEMYFKNDQEVPNPNKK